MLETAEQFLLDNPFNGDITHDAWITAFAQHIERGTVIYVNKRLIKAPIGSA